MTTRIGFRLAFMAWSLAMLPLLGLAHDSPLQQPLTAVPFSAVNIEDAFWSPRIKVNREVTLEANLHQCEITHRIRNFAVAAGLEPGKHEGARYNDSDVYKVLEGAAYSLKQWRDPKLEERIDRIIDLIAAAQQPDGYINTYFTLVKPNDRWKDLAHGHEMYCGGHLIEAAIAYHQATGKRKLLDVAIRFADHIDSVFGPRKRPEPCGHQEIELALVKLHHATGEKRYLHLAKFFLDTRGDASTGRKLFGEYAQDHMPVRQMREVVGHAVRAMYMYCAMADVAGAVQDAELMHAIKAIWHDVVDRKMYLTGGIGPSASNEGFTVPFDLPNDTAYAETCAAIGMALWNHRMFLMTGEGRYVDILEREVYNGMLSGVSLSGDRFFYVNPLASKGAHHRVPWFDCSCCPTNIVRYLPGMGERVYAVKGNAIWTLLYMGNEAALTLPSGTVKIKQTTRYPWDGDITITLHPEKDAMPFDLYLRLPGWLTLPATISGPDGMTRSQVEKGYVRLHHAWKPGDQVRLHLPMPIVRVHADPRVKANEGRVALMRGPMVYCLEGADHPSGKVRNILLPREMPLLASFDAEMLQGVVKITGQTLAVTTSNTGSHQIQPVPLTAIPYAYWDNRTPGEMVVWLPEKAALAEASSDTGTMSRGVLFQASHCYQGDTLAGLNETNAPAHSNDHDMTRMTWWDRRGSKEWLSWKLPEEQEVSQVRVYWFDDTGRGQCRLPARWSLSYKEGDAWKPVTLAPDSQFEIARDRYCVVRFVAVKAREFRLDVELQTGFSGGVLRCHVEKAP